MRIERVAIDRILPLRHAVLRAGMRREAAQFKGDEDVQSVHLAAIDGATGGAEQVIGCLTLMRDALDGRDAWRLRGMAVAEAHRSRGIGAELLREMEAHVREQARLDAKAPRIIWCDARKPAARFYEQNGWQYVSDEYEVPTAGPHYRMRKMV